jgi:hypothetical protein
MDMSDRHDHAKTLKYVLPYSSEDHLYHALHRDMGLLRDNIFIRKREPIFVGEIEDIGWPSCNRNARNLDVSITLNISLSLGWNIGL